MIHEKLVRDYIPEIIKKSGRMPQFTRLTDEQFTHQLTLKLEEEVEEYLASGEVEELADIVEVIYAILKNKNVPQEEFEQIRLQKRDTHGGFDNQFFLIRAD
ncbi:MAG: phosphoribosyl-ATP pyrophosphohydrolase [Firmicutes bacterium]|nr:phosphoribosyl-ATP pyrophosphohydrolase [Bacillota bacterium]